MTTLLLTFNLNLASNRETIPAIDNKLAITWQPAFCETHPYTIECRNQTSKSFSSESFVLHGLWSEKKYCNVSQRIENIDRANKWSDLPPIKLSRNLTKELAIKMPGMVSDLHLHEWYKHGTCYSNNPEEYYQESLDLLDQINNSAVRTFFVKNIDNIIFASDIRQQFDRTFGRNTGTKVTIKCKKDREPKNRNMIVELQLNLKGKIEQNTNLSNLLKQANTLSKGCSVGEVDRVGLNQISLSSGM